MNKLFKADGFFVAKYFFKIYLVFVAIIFASRAFFLIVNIKDFTDSPIKDLSKSFIGGLVYDIATASWCLILFIIPHIAFFFYKAFFLGILIRLWFLVSINFLVFISFFIAFYYPYLHHHLFKEDIALIISHYKILAKLDAVFLVKICFLLLIWSAVCWFCYRWYKKIFKLVETFTFGNKSILIVVAAVIAICFLGVRGVGRLPLSPASASFYSSPGSSAVALNSAYTLMFSVYKKYETIERKNYFKTSEADAAYETTHLFQNSEGFVKKNIVLFIIEHGSNEYFDTAYKNRPEMPFFDSLIKVSTYYNNCYANSYSTSGGIAAIIGGDPQFLANGIAGSLYGSDKVKSFAHILKDSGYTTKFYYSSNDVGNSNSKIAKYYGIDNYDDGASYFKDSDKDNVIGVYDAKFYPFVAQKISELQQPFFVTTENVSTHNPFNLVPKEYLKEHYKSEQEANAAFRYFDDAVAAFFSKIKNQPWFNNSVFIFIGDHCSRSKQLKEYKNDKTNKVALFIYEPGKNENGTSNTLCQQIDIGPSLLDKLNYRGKYFSFGKSIFSPGNRYVYFKDGGISQIRDESYLLNFDDVNDNVVSFKKYAPSLLKSDSLQMKDTLLKKMKAFIQKHNNLIVDNLITPN